MSLCSPFSSCFGGAESNNNGINIEAKLASDNQLGFINANANLNVGSCFDCSKTITVADYNEEMVSKHNISENTWCAESSLIAILQNKASRFLNDSSITQQPSSTICCKTQTNILHPIPIVTLESYEKHAQDTMKSLLALIPSIQNIMIDNKLLNSEGLIDIDKLIEYKIKIHANINTFQNLEILSHAIFSLVNKLSFNHWQQIKYWDSTKLSMLIFITTFIINPNNIDSFQGSNTCYIMSKSQKITKQQVCDQLAKIAMITPACTKNFSLGLLD